MARKRFRRRRRRKRNSVEVIRTKLGLEANVITQKNAVPALNGVVDALVHWRSMSNAYIQQAPPTSQGVVSLNNFAKWKDLFDEYRATYIKLQYVPYFTENQLQIDGSARANSFYISFDADNSSEPVGIDTIISKKVVHRSVTKPWVYKMRLPKMNGQAGTTFGWQNMQNEATNIKGIISIKTPDSMGTNTFPEGGALGSLKMTVWYEFKGRKDSNTKAYYGISRGATGHPALGQPEPHGNTGPVLNSDYQFLQSVNPTIDGVDAYYGQTV